MKKFNAFFMVLFLLIGVVGCDKKTNENEVNNLEIYEGLDALTAYEKMIDYMNENLYYYESERIDDFDNSNMGNTKHLLKDDEETFIYEWYTGNIKRINMVHNDSRYVLNVEETYIEEPQTINRKYVFEEFLNSLADDEFLLGENKKGILFTDMFSIGIYVPISFSKEDKKDSIILNFNFKGIWDDTEFDEEIINYYQTKIIIGKDGYIESESISNYKDDTFEKEEFTYVTTYKNFNKETTFNTDELIKEMKALDGKEAKEE